MYIKNIYDKCIFLQYLLLTNVLLYIVNLNYLYSSRWNKKPTFTMMEEKAIVLMNSVKVQTFTTSTTIIQLV
jgi:hypothetical protein